MVFTLFKMYDNRIVNGRGFVKLGGLRTMYKSEGAQKILIHCNLVMLTGRSKGVMNPWANLVRIKLL